MPTASYRGGSLYGAGINDHTDDTAVKSPILPGESVMWRKATLPVCHRKAIPACQRRPWILASLGTEYGWSAPSIFANRARYRRDTHGFELNYKASYWPRLSLHSLSAISDNARLKIQLPALVSITDHDDVQAPFSCARQIPISGEWRCPMAARFFIWAYF